jgi:hypothetical protein
MKTKFKKLGMKKTDSNEKKGKLIFEVENELREQFVLACKNNDRTASQILRDFMRQYVSAQTKKTNARG